MLDYFSIFIKPEKIHGHVMFIAGPGLVGMERYQVALGNCPYKLDLLIRVVSCHFLEIIDERLLPVTYQWIVLDVFRAHIFFNCPGRVPWISCQVKFNRIILV